MIPRGSFQCAICEEWHHSSKKNNEFRSYFPERRIPVCDYCLHEYRTSPEYKDLRPEVDPNDKEKIERIREYYGENHIYF